MRKLIHAIENIAGGPFPHRWYTDTGPILEREFAQKAGLGWIGKNTCLIHPRKGSYFLLAEILLGLDLEFDVPVTIDYCGSCTRCIDECPTDCILPDRTIDARECISYLTIELKTAIPVDLRPLMGTWVFGCDVCQDVCPWNIRFVSGGLNTVFPPEPGRAHPDLKAEILMDQGEFSAKFKRSPVKRARRRGYLRNVAVALGNSGYRGALPELDLALRSDPEPLVRSHAAWAIGRLGGAEAVEILRIALEDEANRDVILEIEQALQLCQS